VLEPFPHLTDWIHFLAGIISGALIFFIPLISFITCVIYYTYQFTEREPVIETYLDIIEFMSGFIMGLTAYEAISFLTRLNILYTW